MMAIPAPSFDSVAPNSAPRRAPTPPGAAHDRGGHWCARWVTTGLILLLAGCGQRKISLPTTDAGSATVAVVNLSDFEWRIVVTAQHGGLTRTAQLARRAECDLVVPAGDYLIEQTLLAPEAGADTTRRFPLQVAAGKKYRWPLATLLSAEADDPAPGGEGAGR
jgi:hypothetical protein